jgi:hypothetical protein
MSSHAALTKEEDVLNFVIKILKHVRFIFQQKIQSHVLIVKKYKLVKMIF